MSIHWLTSKLRQKTSTKHRLSDGEEKSCQVDLDMPSSSSSSTRKHCHVFSLADIIAATKNFKETYVLGQGGEEKVYRAKIMLGSRKQTQVAVKQLIRPNPVQFEDEIKIMPKIRHPNIVSLLGYCNESGQKILVYEYMEKGSLANYVQRNGRNNISLSWQQRLKICLGAALGLQHLHTSTKEFPQGIIHRDIKPENILLDANWVAKISDFGMFKPSHAGQTYSEMPTNLKGTGGYYAPEYLKHQCVTRKIDVYAFGVVLFQVLCGKMPWYREDGSYDITDDQDLGIWAQQNVDLEIREQVSDDCLKAFTEIIGKCLKGDPKKRFTMDQVVVNLQNTLKCQERPEYAKNLRAAREAVEACTRGPSLASMVECRVRLSPDYDKKLQAAREAVEPSTRETRIDSRSKFWRLLQNQNGLRIFEELVDFNLPKSCCKAMKAVGVVEASCEEIFELVMSMDASRFEWDPTFQYGSLVEEVDGHTAVLYHRLQLEWFPTFVWPRDLCYMRYWRRNDDGSYVVLFHSTDHNNCGPQPGFVRAHIESGGYKLAPLESRNGRIGTQVEYLMQIDLKGWGVGYLSSFQQHCVHQMLNSVAGLRDYFNSGNYSRVIPRIPVMVHMTSRSVPAEEGQKLQVQASSLHQPSHSLDQLNRHTVFDEYSDEDEDEDFQMPED